MLARATTVFGVGPTVILDDAHDKLEFDLTPFKFCGLWQIAADKEHRLSH
jgi:hypothetical protein